MNIANVFAIISPSRFGGTPALVVPLYEDGNILQYLLSPERQRLGTRLLMTMKMVGCLVVCAAIAQLNDDAF